MSLYRVVPDGSVLDRVAEFSYEKKKRIQMLFECDPVGYTIAVADFIQVIACCDKIAGAHQPATTTSTNTLKEELKSANILEYADFFDIQGREERKEVAESWLHSKWNDITSEFENPNSEVAVALDGYLKREFHYFWLKEDIQWTADWYIPIERAFPLIPSVRNRLLNSLKELVQKYKLSVDNNMLEMWLTQSISTHYLIFAEYFLYLGKNTGDEYMPYQTRSKLRIFNEKSPDISISKAIMPFVGLEALTKVNDRRDIIKQIIDWREGKGKEIIQGLARIQEIMRMEKDETEKQHLFNEVQEILSSKTSKPYNVFLSLIRLVTSSLKIEPDIRTAEQLAQLSTSKSYKWLWKIRNPNLYSEIRKKMVDLLTK